MEVNYYHKYLKYKYKLYKLVQFGGNKICEINITNLSEIPIIVEFKEHEQKQKQESEQVRFSGGFIEINVPYEKIIIDSSKMSDSEYIRHINKITFADLRKQVKTFLDSARNILTLSPKFIGIGILYSANQTQTNNINMAYQKIDGNKYLFDKHLIYGSNQAKVMGEMIRYIYHDKYLQNRIRIFPITTILTKPDGDFLYHDLDKPNEKKIEQHLQIIKQDIEKIEKLIQDGWLCFGWTNQHRGEPYIDKHTQKRINNHPFRWAIGGGVVILPPPIENYIQGELFRLYNTYKFEYS